MDNPMKSYFIIVLGAALGALVSDFSPTATRVDRLFQIADNEAIHSSDQDPQIQWLGFQEGYDKAVKEKKPIIIDMYTEWCGYCKRMDKKTFNNASVVDSVHKYFIPVKFNPEEEGKYIVGNKVLDGMQLKSMLSGGVEYGYPTTFFWMRPYQNDKVNAEEGYMVPGDYLLILSQYIRLIK
jgi:thioredoxin-related protein